MHRFTFRCDCGVLVLTDDPVRRKCRSCEPTIEPDKYKATIVLRPPPKEKSDDPKD